MANPTDQGQYAEMLHEMYVLLFPRVNEVFEPVLLGDVEADIAGCSLGIMSHALYGALERLTWTLFETWGTILWDAAEADPANILRLDALDQHMLPRRDISARLMQAEEEHDLLTEPRIREVLRRLRKSLPPGTFLPPQMVELMRLEGRTAVTCH